MQYQLARNGEVVAAGRLESILKDLILVSPRTGKVLTILDLQDVAAATTKERKLTLMARLRPLRCGMAGWCHKGEKGRL